MSKTKIFYSSVGVVITILLIFVYVSSGGGIETKKAKSTRSRRLIIPKSEMTTTTFSPESGPTSTKATSNDDLLVAPETVFVQDSVYLDAASIKVRWTKDTLCNLLPQPKAKEFLKMTVEPVANFIFNDTLGSKCTYNNGDGDEITVQFSVTTYANARKVDIALDNVGETITLSNGAIANVKNSKANGYTLSLKLFGEDLNEILVNAPDETTGKKVAILISNTFKAMPK